MFNMIRNLSYIVSFIDIAALKRVYALRVGPVWRKSRPNFFASFDENSL
jgi:hypothetical protein